MRYLCYLVVCSLCLEDYIAQAVDRPFKKTCQGQLEISFFSEAKLFDAAKQSCENYGGHLVKVDNAAIQQAIEDALGKPDGNRYFIGGLRSEGNNFKWIADESTVGVNGFVNWKPNQPNNLNGREDCMGIGDHYQYEWTDVSCDYTRADSRYICQREKEAFTVRTNRQDNRFTCLSEVPSVSVKWIQNSDQIATTDNSGVYQIISTDKSVLMLKNAIMSDSGKYTCVGYAKCVTKRENVQVTIDGTPTIQKIENNKCNSSLFVTWKPNKAAVGFPHNISVSGFISKVIMTPESNEFLRTEILPLNVSSKYTVEISPCLTEKSCSAVYKAELANKTNGVSDTVTSASLQEEDGKRCKASWAHPDQNATFTITTKCIVDKSRNGNSGNLTTTTTANFSKTEFQFQSLANHRCEVSIQAKGCGAMSRSIKATGICVIPPKEPDSVTAPEVKKENKDSKYLIFSKPSESNGLISCVFVILCHKICPSREFTVDDLRTANKSNNANYTNGKNSIAMVFPITSISQPFHKFELFKEEITKCDVYNAGDPGYNNSSTAHTNETFQGKNQLKWSGEYTGAFIVTTTPSDNRILLKSSSVVTVAEKNEPTTTTATTVTIASGTEEPQNSPPVAGWVIGLVVGSVVLLILAVAVLLLIRKKRAALRKPPEDQPLQYIAQENEAAQGPQNPAPGVPPHENQGQANIGRVEEVNPYANVPPPDQSDGTDIRVSDLEAVYNSMKKNGNVAFNKQYNNVLQEAARIAKPTTAASTFMKKNRYKNILPFDDCRVPLTGSEEGYINASYINGFKSAKKYIATQGPLRSTVADFWMMAMEQNSHVIVMLTKEYDAGKKKCEKYWPDLGKSLNFSNGITVESRQETSCNAYIERILFIRNKNDGSTLVIYQYQFMKWPDHGVPQTTSNLIRMHRIVTNKINELQSQSPIIVHCSAGAGRTGAFLAYDYLLKEAEETGKVDVYRCVVGMRNQRIQMVQNADQYTLVYMLLVEAHIFVDYDCATDELKSKVANFESGDGSPELEREFRELGRMEPMKNSRSVGMEKKHRKFNRGQDAVPYDYSLVSVIMTSEETEPPYINASFIESYDSSTKMIAAQGPFENNVEVFWRVVLDRGVTTIVMLNPLKKGKEEQCARYWPEKVGEVSSWGEVGVVCRRDRALGENISERTLEITRGTETKTVTQFHFTGWKESSCPDDPSEILDIINKMQKHYRSTGEGGTVMIHCNDGIGRTGAFCAIVNLIDRVKWENQIDVFRTVKDLRDGRPNMVKTVDQYRFCYKAIANYLKSFELYANF